MTIWAGRPEGCQKDHVQLGITSGPISITVIKSRDELRHFWGQLGALLEEEAPAVLTEPPPPPADLVDQPAAASTAPLY